MGLFSGFNFPWTDLHTLNLDWLLRSVKSLLDRYNPVAKSEDMTQPVGVDETGKLYTKPSEDPPHADGANYGTVNPVASTSDMSQPVGVDTDGKLFTKPGSGGASDPPHADGTNYGTVNPVASTVDMTQPVGVGSDGKLFTKPGGSAYVIETLWQRPVSDTTQHLYDVEGLTGQQLLSYDVVAVDIFCDRVEGPKQRVFFTNVWTANENAYMYIPCVPFPSSDRIVGYQTIYINGTGSIIILGVTRADSDRVATGACLIDAIYGIRKGEA